MEFMKSGAVGVYYTVKLQIGARIRARRIDMQVNLEVKRWQKPRARAAGSGFA